MKLKILTLLFLFLFSITNFSNAAMQMRPYTGVGVTLLNVNKEDIKLFSHPEIGQLPVNTIKQDSIFKNKRQLSLVVMSKTKDWVKVTYDDGGHEGWYQLSKRDHYLKWEEFLSGKEISFLVGLQQKYYKLHTSQSSNSRFVKIDPKDRFKVVEVENEWLKIRNKNNFVWVKWKDEDNRSLIKIY